MPRPLDIQGRSPLRRAKVVVVVTVLCAARVASAESDRLVLGTHDAALASALSVAVSPRGLSVVELQEPLEGVGDLDVARREIAVPGTVAVVWLCEAPSPPGHALCFCGGDGRLVVNPIPVTSPLAPPDAAAVALSVKMLLGPPSAPGPAAQMPRPTARPTTRPTTPAPLPPVRLSAPPQVNLPAVALELDVGGRLQATSAGPVALRFALKGVISPAALGHRVGVGLGASGGPTLTADGAQPAARRLHDWAVSLFARGRLPARAFWLELDLGPSVHLLSVEAGPEAPRRVDLSFDGLMGAVVPVGRVLLGVHGGGFCVLTSGTGAAGAAAPVELPRWSSELLVSLGLPLR